MSTRVPVLACMTFLSACVPAPHVGPEPEPPRILATWSSEDYVWSFGVVRERLVLWTDGTADVSWNIEGELRGTIKVLPIPKTIRPDPALIGIMRFLFEEARFPDLRPDRPCPGHFGCGQSNRTVVRLSYAPTPDREGEARLLFGDFGSHPEVAPEVWRHLEMLDALFRSILGKELFPADG